MLISEALNSHRPDTPAPVPTSTMFFAPSIAAMDASPAPVAGVTDSTPSCSALLRATLM